MHNTKETDPGLRDAIPDWVDLVTVTLTGRGEGHPILVGIGHDVDSAIADALNKHATIAEIKRRSLESRREHD